MTRRRLLLLVGVWSAALLTACSTPATRVVLLPQPDGKASAVVVRTEEGEETLARPYLRATARAGARGAPVVDEVDPARLQAENNALFELMPPPVLRYTVFFEPGGTDLTASSQSILNEALAAAMARSGGEIVVTGYADTVGPNARNDELSLGRAQQVRRMFLDHRFPAGRIEAVGRGKRELAIQTGDEVDEPSNRRVIIEVR